MPDEPRDGRHESPPPVGENPYDRPTGRRRRSMEDSGGLSVSDLVALHGNSRTDLTPVIPADRPPGSGRAADGPPSGAGSAADRSQSQDRTGRPAAHWSSRQDRASRPAALWSSSSARPATDRAPRQDRARRSPADRAQGENRARRPAADRPSSQDRPAVTAAGRCWQRRSPPRAGTRRAAAGAHPHPHADPCGGTGGAGCRTCGSGRWIITSIPYSAPGHWPDANG